MNPTPGTAGPDRAQGRLSLAAVVEPAPALLPWPEVTDISRRRNMFKPGELVVATEKILGETCLYTRSGTSDLVSSKQHGRFGRAIRMDERELHWRAVLAYHLPWVANVIANMMKAHTVGIFGEIYGAGLPERVGASRGDVSRTYSYGADATADRPGFAVFDVRVETGPLAWWLEPDELDDVMGEIEGAPPLAPRLYSGPYDEQMLMVLSCGAETVSGTARHPRAGLVVRPIRDRRCPGTEERALAAFPSAR